MSDSEAREIAKTIKPLSDEQRMRAARSLQENVKGEGGCPESAAFWKAYEEGGDVKPASELTEHEIGVAEKALDIAFPGRN